MKTTRPFSTTLLASLVVSALGLAGTAYAGGTPEHMAAQKHQIASAYLNTTDRIIVKYKGTSALTGLSTQSVGNARAAASSLSSRYGVHLNFLRRAHNGAQVLKMDNAMSLRDAAALAARIKAGDSTVEYAEPDRMLHPLMVPNDTRYSDQWDLFDPTGGLNVQGAWDKATGSGVYVAVLDTGYRPHADVAANIVGGYDMINDTAVANDGNGRDSDAKDPGDWVKAGECGNGYPEADENSSWHGTHVAGTIAAVTNNNLGIAGIAYNAKVVPVRVLGKCGGYTSDIADGMVWASGASVSGLPTNPYPAKVINLSLGGAGACDTTTQNAINTARARGTVFVIAAGNDNTNVSNANPANCSGVIAIAATNKQGGRAYYSNYGSLIDVAAPGGAQSYANDPNGTLSTLNDGATTPGNDTYVYYQGTSMATPHVAGVAALMLSANPSLTPDQVESLLKSSARAFPATCSQCGAGIVDATAAVNAALGNSGGGGGGGGGNVLQNGVAATGLSASTGSDVVYTMTVPAGASGLSFAISGGSGDADLYVKFGSTPTDSSYDCRPYKSGNAESCAISNVQAGTYYVRVKAYSSYSGVSLVGSYTTGGSGGGGGAPLTYENTTDYAIPDNNATGISSPVSVTRTGASGTVTVDVNIVHTYSGDLVVDLVAPNGTVYNLQNRSGGSADNIVKTFTVNAGSTSSNGTWNLRVKDRASQDTGYINSWKLTFAN